MFPHMSPRRTTAAVAAAAVLLIGTLGLVAPASASDEIGPPSLSGSIALHNATAEPSLDCPDDGSAYWHFVLAPNNGSSEFVTIVLSLDGDPVTFQGDAIVPNHDQRDNVFVAVPAGHTLTSLELDGSYATYTGTEAPTHFNLSHVCEGDVPTTTTTTTASTTTTTEGATTTTAEVLGTTTIDTSGAEVEAATQVAPETLPYTGSETLPLLVVGLSVSAAGLALATMARRRQA
jgi:LPXTG-motif cell wall-anchored protein